MTFFFFRDFEEEKCIPGAITSDDFFSKNLVFQKKCMTGNNFKR